MSPPPTDLVTFLPTREIPGWAGAVRSDGKYLDRYENPCAPLLARSLSEILPRHFQVDAHFQPYMLRDAAGDVIPRHPRLRQPAWRHIQERGIEVLYTAVVLDVDDREAHRLKIPARDEWREETKLAIAALPADLKSGLGWYMSRGGIRLLWTLDPALSPSEYMGLVLALRHKCIEHGLVADRLIDWTRLYRLPFVFREKQNLRFEADFAGLGPLQWRPAGGIRPIPIDPETGKAQVPDDDRVLDRPARSANAAQDPAGAAEGLNLDMVRDRYVLPDTIDDGDRNNELLRYAGWLRRKGATPSVIRAELLRIDRELCKPPIDDPDEIEALVNRVLGYEGGPRTTLPILVPTREAFEPAPVDFSDIVQKAKGGAPEPAAPAKSPAKPAPAKAPAKPAAPEKLPAKPAAPEKPPASPAVPPADPAASATEPPVSGPVAKPTELPQAATEAPAAADPGTPETPADASSPPAAAEYLPAIIPTTTVPNEPVAASYDTAVADGVIDPKALTDFARELPNRTLTDVGYLYEDNTLKLAIVLYRQFRAMFARLTNELTGLKQIKGQVSEWVREIKKQSREQEVADKRQQAAQGGEAVFTLGSEYEIADKAIVMFEQDSADSFIHDRSSFWKYQFESGIWKQVLPTTIKAQLGSFDGALVESRSEKGPSVLKLSNGMANGVEDIMRAKTHRESFFSDAPEGIAFSDCFVRIKDSGEIVIEEPSPDHRCTSRLSCGYPGQKYPIPQKFFGALLACFENDPDAPLKIRMFQQSVGIMLSGRATKYQQGLLLLGDGANGKSTIVNIISALFLADTIAHIAPHDLKDDYKLAMLANARLNLVSELPDNEIQDPSRVKAAITGDSMTARSPYEKPFSFHPTAGHILVANLLPFVRDLSDGFWRRWLILTFNRRFADHERVRDLDKEIIAEELPSIAAWLVEGAVEVIKNNGYVVAPSSHEAMSEWRRGVDSVQEFVETRCAFVDEPIQGTKATPLYVSYSNWARTMGFRAVSSTSLGRRLKTLEVRRNGKKIKVKHLVRNDGVYYAMNVLPPETLGLA